jgi:hypothetical protein
VRYADGLLAGGEVVLRRSRQHWIALLAESRNALLLWAIGIGAWVLGMSVISSINADLGQLVGFLGFGCLLAGLIIVALHAWEWWAQDYLITNRRIVKVEGILNKRAADSSLEKINDAILTQDILGRMFGFGDLDILTAADAAVDRYRMLDRAPDFKRQMLDAKRALEMEIEHRAPPSPPIHGATRSGSQRVAVERSSRETPRPQQRSASPAGPSSGPGQIMDTIARLAELRDRGAISEAEFEAKKRDLLARL